MKLNRFLYTIEELEFLISECQKKLEFAHKLLMEEDIGELEQKRLDMEIKDMHNQIFLYQSHFRKRYFDEFSKAQTGF